MIFTAPPSSAVQPCFGGAKSWNRVRRLYEKLCCARGQAETFIKAHKTQLASERTSCTSATANPFRLFFHGAADWILWSFRTNAAKRSPWRSAQFDTIHNEHADEPVSRFSSRAVALRRVQEVMAQARRRPSRLPVDGVLRALRRGEIEVGALAKSLRVTQRDVRSAIDRLRRQGHRIERLAPCTFGLG